VHQYISKQLCHLWSRPVESALFEPILQRVSRYTATSLVTDMLMFKSDRMILFFMTM